MTVTSESKYSNLTKYSIEPKEIAVNKLEVIKPSEEERIMYPFYPAKKSKRGRKAAMATKRAGKRASVPSFVRTVADIATKLVIYGVIALVAIAISSQGHAIFSAIVRGMIAVSEFIVGN